mgnify:CR=1 FL=1
MNSLQPRSFSPFSISPATASSTRAAAARTRPSTETAWEAAAPLAFVENGRLEDPEVPWAGHAPTLTFPGETPRPPRVSECALGTLTRHGLVFFDDGLARWVPPTGDVPDPTP